jgi:hypothetical protein
MTGVVAFAALCGLAVWLVIESRGGSTTTTTAAPANPPVVLSQAGLETIAGSSSEPIYWVGAKPGISYELTRTSGRVYLRYLPRSVKAGDPRPFLTIGTYAMSNAYAVMQKSENGSGVVVLKTPGNGIAVINKNAPTSAYLAFPNSNFQVEIYSPDPALARQLVASGRVQPVVTNATPGGPLAVTPDKLRELAASLGYPIYWAGPRAHMTYELTRTAQGTFVRYLPAGVPVGEKKPYLTIGTYPLAHAYAVTKAGAKKDGRDAVTLNLPNGRIAVYAKGRSTNVHLADPGSSVQVEIYDPSPKVPPKLASSGLIAPVG